MRKTLNQLIGVKLSNALLNKPVLADEIVACTASGNAVAAEALKASMTDAIVRRVCGDKKKGRSEGKRRRRGADGEVIQPKNRSMSKGTDQ